MNSANGKVRRISGDLAASILEQYLKRMHLLDENKIIQLLVDEIEFREIKEERMVSVDLSEKGRIKEKV